MEWLQFTFPISEVHTYIFLPPVVMFLISTFTSMGGVSGAFVLLPFQMSVLGYTAPGVTATNFVYNIVAIPVGVVRFMREKRLSWPLFAVLMAGTLPGVFLGYYLRVTYMPQPNRFKLFAGLVLAYLGLRTLWGTWGRGKAPASSILPGELKSGKVGLRRCYMEYTEGTYGFATPALFIPALVVGVIGGAYGIGGGAMLAPYCISVLDLPPHVVAGAALSSTWVSSIVAALFYAFVPLAGTHGASPDWLLGAMFGIGGMAGIYLGARLQRRFPTRVIRIILGVAVLLIAVKYAGGPLWGLLSGMLMR